MRAADVRAVALAGTLLLAAAVAQRGLEWSFATRPTVAVVIGALGLDLWAQRLGVRWTAGEPKAAPLAAFALGLAMGLLVVLVGALVGALRLELGWAAIASIGFGTLRVVVDAFRDELLYRGIPLALVRHHVRPAWAIAFSAVLGVAPIAFSSWSRPDVFLLGAATSLFLTLTWSLGSGGLAAWGIHSGWLFAIQVAARGAPFDVTWQQGGLASTTEAAGLPAYAGAAVFAVAAFMLYGRRHAARR